MKPRAVLMLGIVLKKTWGFANIKVQTSLCMGSLINTFAIRLLENIVLLSTHYCSLIDDLFNFKFFIVRRSN